MLHSRILEVIAASPMLKALHRIFSKNKHNYFLENTKFTPLAEVTIFIAIISALFAGIYILEFFFQLSTLIQFLSDIASPIKISPVEELGSTSRHINSLFFINISLYLGWLFFAYQNLYSLGFKTTSTPRNVVLENLIPVINLRGIYVYLKEIWLNTVDSTQWVLIKAWWFTALLLTALKLIGGFNALKVLRTLSNYETQHLERYYEIVTMLVLSCTILLLSALFFVITIRIVIKVTTLQRKRSQVPNLPVSLDTNTITDKKLANKKSLSIISKIIFLVIALLILTPLLIAFHMVFQALSEKAISQF
ncbi:MAG: DUF4328 domain-containing protein [Candidatus Abawacabacteria bacterium]|nr:DUF4328 domain-containing protein [Candidatus Abawacabacteria bacterium]